jgi:AraC family transcriptional regulator of arabinose operon
MPGAWLLTYTIAGHGRYRSGRSELTTNEGDAVLVRGDASIEHSVPEPGPWEYCFARFDAWPQWRPAEPFERSAEGLYRSSVRLPETRQRIEDAFRRLIADVRRRDVAQALTGLRRGEERTQELIAEARRQLAVIALSEILLLIGGDPLESQSLDPRVVGALQVVADDLATHHDIEDLTRMAGLSASRFRHLFREQIGLPFRRAVRLIRLRQVALRLVHTDEPVGAIAEETGFSSIFDLSRQFRRHYGVSPRAYRERARTLELPPPTPRRRRP